VKLFPSYLVVVATVIAAFASVAQASSDPATRALQIRGEGMNALCQSATLSREAYVAVCGTKGASEHPTRAVLRAYEVRGQGMDALYSSRASDPALKALQVRGAGMNALCQSPTLPRESYIAVCGTKGASQQPTRAELRAYQIRGAGLDAVSFSPVVRTVPSSGFDWSDFGIGAASMLGLVLLAGGVAAGVHYGRKSTIRPRPAA
jgi:hypothetical protein